MTENNKKINELSEKLATLVQKQVEFIQEINELRYEVNKIKISEENNEKVETKVETPVIDANAETVTKPELLPVDAKPVQPQIIQEPITKTEPSKEISLKGKSDLEKFIGENLTNKIGIIITIIGVAIGAKYSIENNLVSPLTRIIMGYLFGLGLLGVGIKLKRKYENYSAVLVSGAMAIMYFITYSAYAFYELIPQIVAFSLMLVFTVFTVLVALKYNRQIVAHIGLVGAYAVPFLLGESSGKVVVLFTYMAILNVGILAISIKKYWKPLYYVSFGLTWFIFLIWYVTKYNTADHFGLALIFSIIFFVVFYLTFLAYKLLKKEIFAVDDIFLLMINSIIFYLIGYGLLENHPTGKHLLGTFTLLNAAVHFIASLIIYQQKLADKIIQYIITGLVLIFITIAIPVQLDGNWVSLLWAGEAALLFWIGRTKSVAFYEKVSYALMLLALISILHDWTYIYQINHRSALGIRTIFNVNFLTSCMFIGLFAFINVLNLKKAYTSAFKSDTDISKLISILIPAILIFTIYMAFYLEISNYWNKLISAQNGNLDLTRFKEIWLFNYSLFFISVLTFINLKKFKNQQFRLINLSLNVITIIIYLFVGLYTLSELRDSYLQTNTSPFLQSGIFNLWIRYISFSFVALAIYAFYKNIKASFAPVNAKIGFDLFFHTTLLWIGSSELIHWMDVYRSEQSYKLGLSILWGLYSLFLISLGIWKNNKPMRIGAIVLFGITLLKLFFYDIAHLNTISKTVVFVSLGVLLLIISFLYNKYKHFISDNESNN